MFLDYIIFYAKSSIFIFNLRHKTFTNYNSIINLVFKDRIACTKALADSGAAVPYGSKGIIYRIVTEMGAEYPVSPAVVGVITF